MTKEVKTDLLQDSKEVIAKVPMVKKIGHLENPLNLKKSLMVVKKNHLIDSQKNLGNQQFRFILFFSYNNKILFTKMLNL